MWYLLAAVGAFTGIAVAVSHFTGAERVRRKLRTQPATRIAEMTDDMRGKVVGTARAVGELLEAPLSKRPCIAYAVTVLEHSRHSGGKIHETRCASFVLEDGSGRALVDATDAHIAITGGGNVQSGSLDDPSMAAELFLQRHGRHAYDGAITRRLYREAVVFDGDRIAVLGAGTREPDPDAQPTAEYRGDQPTRLRLTSSPKHPLVISDDPTVLD